ncbi:Kinesin-like protein KIF9 [Triplophysa tibetana]|uniref:Kinesin-like protein KIF9 n=1 Tax=Triplophysa tibetana TaxID=1572043 RepID=A0A5A9PRX0_9TELE|nr:Kinesin-like protein KIF9 [Triplophysa tibetana]
MNTQASPVKVYVRIRPTANFAHEFIECLPDLQTLSVRWRKESKKRTSNIHLNSWLFKLNGVLHNVSQEEVYDCVAQSVVLGAFEGYNGTIMCFGQTGAGKTYTMTGAAEAYKQRGIIPRVLQQVFHEVEHQTDQSFSVHLSFLEIYNETLVDLLSALKRGKGVNNWALGVVEEPGGGVSIKGLTLHLVHNEEEALNLLFESEGQVQREAMYINKSLSFLEQAILALADSRREHVPFRQSKLTHALKDSLEQQRTEPNLKEAGSSPPPKADAFEDFKADRGSEINRILKENKTVLLERRSRLETLTDVINATKRDMDSIASLLHQYRGQSQGQFVSAEGEHVMEEAELSLVMQLRELKNVYRKTYEEYNSTKAEVSYCQHLVNQCRVRLLTEFESWYNESFLLPGQVLSLLEGGPIRPGHVPVDKALTLEDDEQKTFRHPPDNQQETSSAISFYNAYNRSLQRKVKK